MNNLNNYTVINYEHTKLGDENTLHEDYQLIIAHDCAYEEHVDIFKKQLFNPKMKFDVTEVAQNMQIIIERKLQYLEAFS